MPPRRKPTSARQKKVDTQLKRAIKRGDVPPPDPKKKPPRPKGLRRGPTGNPIGSAADPSTAATIQAARRLQSAFVTLPPKFLEETKLLSSTLPLLRPVPYEAAVFADTSDVPNKSVVLSCPRRPKWRFDMSKKEVEHNEEAIFKKWLEEMDGVVQKWQTSTVAMPKDHSGEKIMQPLSEMPRSPTYFERNLEVWRQLWRVTEISQIILVLLDSRCPLLHFPPSLSGYLSDQHVILVLTKVDISGSRRAAAWVEYFHNHYPHLRVVQVESYVAKDTSIGHQGKKQFEPHLPETFRERLVDAIRDIHVTMLQPPDKIKNDPARLQKWKPHVKPEIDWGSVLRAEGPQVGVAPPAHKDVEDNAAQDISREPEYLTIGLIGQPNVGKSSLLNALFGINKVRASKTPGKTKHFQTLFWTPEIRLVDCPGLVMPNFVPMEMQVLCGILPISRVSAIPSCIYHASQLLPIEQIYKLVHPSLSTPQLEDKRTWREGMRINPTTEREKLPEWTAMDLLIAYAGRKGWVTAKAGRPDIHRAGNAILRGLAEGKVGWAFWPPETSIQAISAETGDPVGVWIPHTGDVDEESDEDSDNDEDDNDETASQEGSTIDEDDDRDDACPETVIAQGIGRFAALILDDADEEYEDIE